MSTSQKNRRTLLPFQKRAPTSRPFPRENSPFSWMKVKFLKLAALEGKTKGQSGTEAHLPGLLPRLTEFPGEKHGQDHPLLAMFLL